MCPDRNTEIHRENTDHKCKANRVRWLAREGVELVKTHTRERIIRICHEFYGRRQVGCAEAAKAAK